MDHAEKLVFALRAPIIAWPGWEGAVTDGMKMRIYAARLANVTSGDTATCYEAMVYLHTASLAATLSEEWLNIYLYLFQQFHADKARTLNIPKIEELRLHEEPMLRRLRSWIHRQQLKAWKENQKCREPKR